MMIFIKMRKATLFNGVTDNFVGVPSGSNSYQYVILTRKREYVPYKTTNLLLENFQRYFRNAANNDIQ